MSPQRILRSLSATAVLAGAFYVVWLARIIVTFPAYGHGPTTPADIWLTAFAVSFLFFPPFVSLFWMTMRASDALFDRSRLAVGAVVVPVVASMFVLFAIAAGPHGAPGVAGMGQILCCGIWFVVLYKYFKAKKTLAAAQANHS
jgi:hypothetical protein